MFGGNLKTSLAPLYKSQNHMHNNTHFSRFLQNHSPPILYITGRLEEEGTTVLLGLMILLRLPTNIGSSPGVYTGISSVSSSVGLYVTSTVLHLKT